MKENVVVAPYDQNFKSYINTMNFSTLGGEKLHSQVEQIDQNTYKVLINGALSQKVVGEWHTAITPAFTPDFYWAPHLTPKDNSVIDMHVFRAPGLIMKNHQQMLAIVPDVTILNTTGNNRFYLDMDAVNGQMKIGITTTKTNEHVLYQRTDEAVFEKGDFSFSFFIYVSSSPLDIENPFRKILAYFWQHFGREDQNRLPETQGLMPYVHRTYQWAFENWKDQVWQEFEIEGQRVGAPQFIVTVFQSPNYQKPYSIREELSIWNQAWFSSLRTAMGVFRYAKAFDKPELLEKARLTKELALAFPQKDGLFSGVIAVPNREVMIEGKPYTKAESWREYYFGNSNRNPKTRSIKHSPMHILDMSWTALHMITWYQELEKDERLLEYASRYADKLLSLQDEKGYFPAWIDEEGHILQELVQSPESAVSATFLLHLYDITKNKAYKKAALAAIDVLVNEVLPIGRWEDFETYWSCSPYGQNFLQGKKCERSGMFKQCTFSMFFLAQALQKAYKVTENEAYLTKGLRCVDELLMAQSSFQPQYMPITVVAGFGVMNADGELNDARQSLFAETIIEYGLITGKEEYLQRGYAALRASFSMMYCPENPAALAQWEKKWPFLAKEDYGFMMENYGHDGYADEFSRGIGEFTIYDWGNGAASEAVMRIKDHMQKGE